MKHAPTPAGPLAAPPSAPASAPAPGGGPESIEAHYRRVRAASADICRTLATEDYVVQTMPDVSPTKWHLAHTTWFFETFVLKDALPDARPYRLEYPYLFNSYYNLAGPQFPRPDRGLLSRPTVAEVYAFRDHVDRQMEQLFERGLDAPVRDAVVTGLHHEQQHQELMLMDIQHVFWTNPLRPALREEAAAPSQRPASALEWCAYDEGLYTVGYDGPGFHFDNEGPVHQVFLAPWRLASRLVTNAEYLEFMGDGGYERPELWLSDGWTTVRERGWRAPLYWEQRDDGAWWEMTLGGMRPLDPHQPVVHVSHYEADAFARWADARLPTEFEWEVAARSHPIAGNFVDDGRLHPVVAPAHAARHPAQLFGDAWEWTSSAYLPYPGYRPPPGALGEYNGKFMSGQMVLRGGACVTPRDHVRASYRNFFPPSARWPYAGVRLARDA